MVVETYSLCEVSCENFCCKLTIYKQTQGLTGVNIHQCSSTRLTQSRRRRRRRRSRRRNTKQPLWFDSPYMLMLWRPNSCCGVCVSPPSPQPDGFPTLFWTCNNKALINKVYFPVNLGAPLPANIPIFVPVPASLFDKTNPDFTPPPRNLEQKHAGALISKPPPWPLPLFLEEPPSPKKGKKSPSLPSSYLWTPEVFSLALRERVCC